MVSYRKYLTKEQIKEKRKIRNSVDGMFKWETKTLQLLARALGMCDKCGHVFKYPRIYRQGSAFNEEHMNYVCMCSSCRDKNEEYWDAMWEDFGYGRVQ